MTQGRCRRVLSPFSARQRANAHARRATSAAARTWALRVLLGATCKRRSAEVPRPPSARTPSAPCEGGECSSRGRNRFSNAERELEDMRATSSQIRDQTLLCCSSPQLMVPRLQAHACTQARSQAPQRGGRPAAHGRAARAQTGSTLATCKARCGCCGPATLGASASWPRGQRSQRTLLQRGSPQGTQQARVEALMEPLASLRRCGVAGAVNIARASAHKRARHHGNSAFSVWGSPESRSSLYWMLPSWGWYWNLRRHMRTCARTATHSCSDPRALALHAASRCRAPGAAPSHHVPPPQRLARHGLPHCSHPAQHVLAKPPARSYTRVAGCWGGCTPRVASCVRTQ